MPKITEMFAFIAEDEGPDDEGIIGMPMGDMVMPLVGADMERVDSLRPLAKDVGLLMGKKVKLIRFSVREDLEDVT